MHSHLVKGRWFCNPDSYPSPCGLLGANKESRGEFLRFWLPLHPIAKAVTDNEEQDDERIERNLPVSRIGHFNSQIDTLYVGFGGLEPNAWPFTLFEALECPALKDLRYLAWSVEEFKFAHVYKYELGAEYTGRKELFSNAVSLSEDNWYIRRSFRNLREFSVVLNDTAKNGTILPLTTKVDINQSTEDRYAYQDSMAYTFRIVCKRLRLLKKMNEDPAAWIYFYFGLPITVKSIVRVPRTGSTDRREELLMDLEVTLRQVWSKVD